MDAPRANEGNFLFLKERSDGVTVAIKVKPRSAKSGPDKASCTATELGWRLQSAPVDGKANTELMTLVANFFDIAKSQVELLVGEKSRSKVLLLKNVTLNDVTRRIV